MQIMPEFWELFGSPMYMGFLEVCTLLNTIFCQDLKSSFNVGAYLYRRFIPQYIPDVFINQIIEIFAVW
jgi:hypothetical protein